MHPGAIVWLKLITYDYISYAFTVYDAEFRPS
jgi:hypothetical protein